MNNIKKINFWRVVLSAIPIGLVSLIFGINYYITTPSTIEEFVVSDGIPKKFGTVTINSSGSTFFVYFIQLGEARYNTIYGKERDLLISKFPHYGNETIQIWHKKGEFGIRQLVAGENVLIEYHPPYWIAYVFFGFGLILLVSSGFYLVRHPEDLFGGDKEKFKKFWKDW